MFFSILPIHNIYLHIYSILIIMNIDKKNEKYSGKQKWIKLEYTKLKSFFFD